MFICGKINKTILKTINFILSLEDKLMKDLLLALSLFSNINILKSKSSKASMRFTLCYLPFIGVILGGLLIIWNYGAVRFGINDFIRGAVSTVIVAFVTGNKHFGDIAEVFGKFKIISVFIYGIILMAMFCVMDIKGILIVSGVFVLVRVMAVLFVLESSRLESGLYKHIADRSRKIFASVIAVVWLMATVSYLEMLNIVYFIIIFVSVLIILIVFNKRAKMVNKLEDKDINFFIVICEFAVFFEIALLTYVSMFITTGINL